MPSLSPVEIKALNAQFIQCHILLLTFFCLIVRVFFFLGTGLVHVSEMSASRIENASEIVDVGEQVWIKVIGREVNTHSHIHRRPFFCDSCRFTEALFTDSW